MVVCDFSGEASIPVLLSQIDPPLAKVVHVVVVCFSNNATLLGCIDGSRCAERPLRNHTARPL